MEGEKFALAKIHTSAKICTSAKNLLKLIFCSSSASDFKSVKLILTRILRGWINSTNLALIACKNYKISHKNAISRIAGTLMCKSG